MAELRVERKGGGKAWIWILVALVVLIIAAVLLDRAGYIDLPFRTGAVDPEPAILASLASAAVHLQEA
jgi:putative copper export protein